MVEQVAGFYFIKAVITSKWSLSLEM